MINSTPDSIGVAVNALDWSIMNAAWFTSNATADINADGIVNSIDFGLMNPVRSSEGSQRNASNGMNRNCGLSS